MVPCSSLASVARLSNGEKHDGRAPDYDDWSTVGENGLAGLNGDILIWYPVLGRSFELSSMGIRVDKESLLRQLQLEGKEERETLYFHQKLLHDEPAPEYWWWYWSEPSLYGTPA